MKLVINLSSGIAQSIFEVLCARYTKEHSLAITPVQKWKNSYEFKLHTVHSGVLRIFVDLTPTGVRIGASTLTSDDLMFSNPIESVNDADTLIDNIITKFGSKRSHISYY